MTTWRAVAASPKARIVAGAVLGYLAWQLWLTLAAPQKIAPGFTAERPRANILVTLPFPPERFHVLYFQRYGRVSGTQDNAIEVRNVRQADLAAVARPYWVRRVEPLPTGG
ncbi:MAG TPA: hypothetical protein VF601_16335 [Beijerinckiaceae bacterium]|jgi:hypothetical protein